MNIKKIHQMVLKDGLRHFKFKNTKYQDVPYEEKKGSIFAYRNKKNMICGRGVVITSLEAVEENQSSFTHWTPNVYRYGTYTQTKPRITQGHRENNIRQINTFYVDFDIKNQKETFNCNDILVSSLDLGFMPTLILKTDNGYQAYFILKDVAYVTATSDFKVVNVAKIISQNIREHFKRDLPLDMTCNHFGIARMPREDNIEYFNKDNSYTFSEWFNWSMQQDDLLYTNKNNRVVLSGIEGKKQIDEPWYHLLKNSSKICGKKNLMGRNNVIFTLALANYASGIFQTECLKELTKFNNELDTPLNKSELNKTIVSAYSGKYKAASREFIKILCQTWVDPNLSQKELFISQRWHKFKKSREQRQRSHLSEWKEDVIDYVIKKTTKDNPYIRAPKKVIIEALGIPERSLDYVLKDLQEEGSLIYSFKRGRGGGITLASIRTIALSLIEVSKKAREVYYQYLSRILEFSLEKVAEVFDNVLVNLRELLDEALFEFDTG